MGRVCLCRATSVLRTQRISSGFTLGGDAYLIHDNLPSFLEATFWCSKSLSASPCVPVSHVSLTICPLLWASKFSLVQWVPQDAPPSPLPESPGGWYGLTVPEGRFKETSGLYRLLFLNTATCQFLATNHVTTGQRFLRHSQCTALSPRAPLLLFLTLGYSSIWGLTFWVTVSSFSLF